jgi:hypothetical protein
LPTSFGLPYAAHGLPGRAIWAVCHCAGVYETRPLRRVRDEPNLYWEDPWGVAGLRAGAELLRAVDQPDAAAEAERFAAAMWEDLERSLELTAERLGTVAIPAAADRFRRHRLTG